MTDITALILDDHEWLRRAFARLDDADGPEALSAVWAPLATRLDTHAEAEETVFYPALLDHGKDAEDETDDAIDDHNKIRDAVAEAGQHAIGSPDWYDAVGRARTENSKHIAEEERKALPDFRKTASDQLRAALAERWRQFYDRHPGGRGVDAKDKDPDTYIADHTDKSD